MSEGPTADLGRSRAVLMATWDYDHFESAPAVANSYRRLRALLTDPVCGSWPESSIVDLENRRDPYRARIELIDAALAAEEVLLFYYMGHGVYDDRLNLGLAVGESREQQAYVNATTLGFDAVREAFAMTDAAVKIVILDCCYAGFASLRDGRLSAQGAPAIGSYLMMSSSEYEESWFETGTEDAQTYFSRCFADAVEYGVEGAPAGLTLDHVFKAVAPRLVSLRKPLPRCQTWDRIGDWVFAANRAAPPGETGPEANYERARRLESEAGAGALRQIEALYESAARAGHVPSMVKAGHIAEGRLRAQLHGVPPPRPGEAAVAAATGWYTRAAAAGDTAAATELGRISEEAFGDTERALDWYDLAARRGNTFAAERFRGLERRRSLGLDSGSAAPDEAWPVTAGPSPTPAMLAARRRWLAAWDGAVAMAIAECLDALVRAYGGEHGEWAVLTGPQRERLLTGFMSELPERARLALAAADFRDRVGFGHPPEDSTEEGRAA